MTVRKLTSSEKFVLSLIIHTILFGGIFTLGLFGLTTNTILLILITVVSLELIYLEIFTKMSVNRNTHSLEEMGQCIENIEKDEEKAHTALIYIGHQMRAIQHELDTLRKNGIYKPTRNNPHPKIHT